jgi:hypothetical protein
MDAGKESVPFAVVGKNGYALRVSASIVPSLTVRVP